MREDDLDTLALTLGAMYLGAVPVPINGRYKVRELEYVAANADLRILFVGDAHRPIAAAASLPSGCAVVERSDPEGSEGAEAELPREAPPAANDDAMILYTSGTTANPKGCVYSHAGMVAQGFAFSRRLGLDEADRFFTPLPFCHVSAIVSLLATLAARCAIGHVGERFDPELTLTLLERERCTVAFPCFETIWLQVLDLPGFADADLTALRLVLDVGTPGSLRKMQERLPRVPQVSVDRRDRLRRLRRASAEARDPPGGAGDDRPAVPLAGVELRRSTSRPGDDVGAGDEGRER